MANPAPTWGEVYEAPADVSANDLLRLPDDGGTYELYDGMLIRGFTTPGHGAICFRMGGVLYVYAQSARFRNRIVQNALFDLTPPRATRKTVLAPDLAIMRGAVPPSWSVPREAPLLAVEVISTSQTTTELALKARFYRNNGVDEVWLVDHRSRSVEIWDAQGRTTLDDSATLTSALLPGFSVAVAFLLDG